MNKIIGSPGAKQTRTVVFRGCLESPRVEEKVGSYPQATQAACKVHIALPLSIVTCATAALHWFVANVIIVSRLWPRGSMVVPIVVTS